MKKLVLLIAAASLLWSCNRELSTAEQEVLIEESRIHLKTGSDLRGELIPMSESFTINSKAAARLGYTYQNFAEAPHFLQYTEELNGGLATGTSNLAQATSVTANGELVFVTWHLEGAKYGGAISAYKLDYTSGGYTYTGRVDFEDTDWHEAAVNRNSLTGNYEVFAVGQRSPSTSGYQLNGHRGAVVGKVLYDYINDEFVPASSYKELPLPGYGANSIISSAGKYYVVTGNGIGSNTQDAQSGVYVTDYNLSNVSEAMTITDGIFIKENPFTATPGSVDFSVLDRTAVDKIQVRTNMNTSQTVSNSMSFTIDYYGGNIGFNSLMLERGGMAYVPFTYSGNTVTSSEYLLALGQGGVYSKTHKELDNGIPYCLSLTHDPSARVIYAAAGDQGLKIMAGKGYNGGVLINGYDLIGSFIPPTNAAISGFNVKDVSVYFSDFLALAVGGTDASGSSSSAGGVYFVRKTFN
jgi:hypothetical protein